MADLTPELLEKLLEVGARAQYGDDMGGDYDEMVADALPDLVVAARKLAQVRAIASGTGHPSGFIDRAIVEAIQEVLNGGT